MSELKLPTYGGTVLVGRRPQPRRGPVPEPKMSELKLPTYGGHGIGRSVALAPTLWVLAQALVGAEAADLRIPFLP